MRRLVPIVAAVVLLSPPVRAQGVPEYLTLVREYVGGQGGSAVLQLARWRDDEVTNAVRTVAATSSSSTLVAAAMLETDLANTIVDTDASKGTFAITTAQHLLKAGHPEQNDRLRAFTRRWFQFVASMFASCGRFGDASWYVRSGLLAFPRDPMLYVARGALEEMRVRVALWPDLRRGLPASPRLRTRIEQMLKPAVESYQQALDADGLNAVAHLKVKLKNDRADITARPGYFVAQPSKK